MNLIVDTPILNNPFEEPTRYWNYREKQPYVENGRRPAGYYFKARKRRPDEQMTLFTDEQFVELAHIQHVRGRVNEWRQNGYPGVTEVTRQLLYHWNSPDRSRKLFFCQREAAETIIWLVEIAGGRAFDYASDKPIDSRSLALGYGPLRRYGCKMATGSGKTVVMAMVAAWSVLNRQHGGSREKFSDAVLIVCPNLTVRERLQVLKPSHPENYYQGFELVPPRQMEVLGGGKFLITNWHTFAPADDSRKRGVQQRGEMSDKAFADSVLLKGLGSAKNVLVFNDEAHHAYRPALLPEDDKSLQGLTAEEQRKVKEEKEEATVWIGGLDRINAARKINFCLDLSATPFFLQGSGYPEGSPLPWLVSDFGLVDAIESGLVKIPRVPVDANSGSLIPEYFGLWDWIMGKLPAAERGRGRKPDPEAVLREADGALKQLAGEWKRTLTEFGKSHYAVPPCLVLVCNDTNLSQLFHEYIAQHGQVFPELLQNRDGNEVTLRIDSRLLAEAEREEGSGTKADAGQALRLKVNTIGKEGQPGADVRCVVSVAMLTEGWDAQNVTQILGLRPFQSQLLCEQVVGRGLRRTHYNFEFDENGVPTNEEYVDVYGIPFEVIPVKKRPTRAVPPKASALVKALPERKDEFEIQFPRVEGYVFEVRQRIKCNVADVEVLTVEPNKQPTQTVVRAQVGYLEGAPSVLGPGKTVTQTRQAFYESVRFQQIEYEIARRLTNTLLGVSGGGAEGEGKLNLHARHALFSQVLQVVRQFLNSRVDFGNADRRELGLEGYMQQVVDRLCAKIEPDESDGEAPLLPRLERFRPKGSTCDVLFRTVKEPVGTVKSHVSHVVIDSKAERQVAFALEQSPLVRSYVKNDHLEFVIPYTFGGQRHNYYPDYLVRLTNGTMLILEFKGYQNEEARQKSQEAARWVSAVNHWGEMGQWAFEEVRKAEKIPAVLARCGEK